MTCSVCGRRFAWSGRGRAPSACGQRCRKRRSRSTLPAALTELVRWTCRDGKRPIQVDGRPASSTNPTTWTTYSDVADRPHGVMLGDGLCCWDLDNVIDTDGVLDPAAVAVLDFVGPTALWTERSMSGRGLHIFVHSSETESRVGDHVSFYAHSRFIAVTGQRYQ